MSIGLVGRKSGMTRIFSDDGVSTPVTVIEILPARVTEVKTVESCGYDAIQITTGDKKSSRVSKPEAGVFSKANVAAGRGLWEFRLDSAEEAADIVAGSEMSLDVFEAGQKVDVRGVSKGKGFAGVIKRWNFQMQDATHGNSLSHRAPGSIGQCQTPGRVWKGKKMAGHMGAVNRTIQNLEVVRVDLDKGLLMVKGAVPGAPGGDLVIKQAVKVKRG
ncbi:MAG: 50S ribosomal protein L3 [Pseudomonadales bacterium]|jgi:large subunit ribosomal protein L3|nr:50S ribosomal protein L3 [Pseudomonadales bacterium]